ncbi:MULTISPECIES: serine hydrolase [unclassified Algibacter]|uniref:serine hydrolase n=1 Tax=unclassified Algibacter TaxID=2615009 RepID=UPI00131B2895|nr:MULTISPECIES: serine hydrolase [unclassified Algibacter]MCL5130308.1 class A beta-lactamase-related serine hydrolase [Algibacter sp. L4_22]
MKNINTLIVLLLISAFSKAQELPVKINTENKPLRNLLDISLQKKLDSEMNKHAEWKTLISQKKMAVGLVDLSDKNNIKFARVNGNEMMYAASLPKIAVLLSAMDAMEKGELVETTTIKNDMKLMISNSNNAATTRMIDRLGYDKIEKVLTSDRYNLYDEETGGGLWVGKRYAAGGATNREPIKNLSHAATVTQVCRFYYLLYKGELVNPTRSKQMLDILEAPALHHKFVNTLDRIAPKARLFRKSGSWKSFHSDSILVWGSPDRRYILVALINDNNGEQIIRDLIIPIEKVLNN